jgi:hypothetical protein
MKDDLKDLVPLAIIVAGVAGMIWAVWTFGGR